MPKFIVHRTVNQQIAVEATNAATATDDAVVAGGEIISHNENFSAQPDNRKPASTASAQTTTSDTAQTGGVKAKASTT